MLLVEITPRLEMAIGTLINMVYFFSLFCLDIGFDDDFQFLDRDSVDQNTTLVDFSADPHARIPRYPAIGPDCLQASGHARLAKF